MTPLLIATHVVAFASGCLLTYVVTVRSLRVRDVGGHQALELTQPGEHMSALDTLRRSKVTIVLLVATVVVIAIGVQAKLASDDNADRDARQRAYTLCLSRFAGNLVRNLDHRADASKALEKADRAKNEALDQLLVITLQARGQAHPSKTLTQAFDTALKARVEAQVEYNRVYEHVQQVRASNPYVPPRAVCS